MAAAARCSRAPQARGARPASALSTGCLSLWDLAGVKRYQLARMLNERARRAAISERCSPHTTRERVDRLRNSKQVLIACKNVHNIFICMGGAGQPRFDGRVQASPAASFNHDIEPRTASGWAIQRWPPAPSLASATRASACAVSGLTVRKGCVDPQPATASQWARMPVRCTLLGRDSRS